MKSSLHANLPAASVILGLLLFSTASAQSGSAGYQPPNFFALTQQDQAARMPAMPASPLAGGMPAARGDAFIDAHGNPIVLPASYNQGCQGGGGRYDDGMAIDFGGYGTDQSGPHYFDISADIVYLQGEDLFKGVQPFTSEGVGALAPKFIDPTSYQEYEPGWRIALRYDLGPLSVLEATYMGLYDMGFSQQVRSVDVTSPSQDFQLFSIFSGYGVGTLIDGVDDGQVHRLDYESDLQSTEISYRRYWVGYNPRISGTFLLGFRYLRMTEDLAFNTTGMVIASPDSATRVWSSENDLLGAQLGGDGWITLRQGLRFGGEAKAGIYNNRFTFTHSGDLPGTTNDFSSETKGNQVAFAAEGSLSLVADILPSLSIRGGYQVLYLNSLATAGNNVDPTNYYSTAVLSQADALYHGFNGGVEYIW